MSKSRDQRKAIETKRFFRIMAFLLVQYKRNAPVLVLRIQPVNFQLKYQYYPS